MQPSFTVRLEVFEGPLELLLALIERQELDISAVSLVSVTDQFLLKIAGGEGIDLDQIADYLVVASKLLLIKSKSLLPKPPVVEATDDEPPIDAAEELAKQLRAYRRIKVGAEWIRNREDAGLRSWPRRVPPVLGQRRLAPISIQTIYAAYLATINREPGTSAEDEVPARINLAERIEEIRKILRRRRELTFRTLLPASPNLSLVVATFLAILELLRRGLLDIRQESNYGDIAIWSTEPRTSSERP